VLPKVGQRIVPAFDTQADGALGQLEILLRMLTTSVIRAPVSSSIRNRHRFRKPLLVAIAMLSIIARMSCVV
jgi:hypothetical protein